MCFLHFYIILVSRSARKANRLTSICEPIVYKKGEP
jgi:hypothetical protein